jgi:Fic family protein
VHLYFESTHPFEDGNGRIGRALLCKPDLIQHYFETTYFLGHHNREQQYAEKSITQLKSGKAVTGARKKVRRKFSSEYTLQIIGQADACPHGVLGKILRREKLYSNQLQQWRREFAEQGAEGFGRSKPSPSY